MPIDKGPPPPPRAEQPTRTAQSKEAPIVDMRQQFERKTPPTAEDRARARAFIEGKIKMIRSDPRMSDAEKAAAIAELEAKL
jgi:hypothetical protein